MVRVRLAVEAQGIAHAEETFVSCQSIDSTEPNTVEVTPSNDRRWSSSTEETKTLGYGRRTRSVWHRLDLHGTLGLFIF